MSQLFFEPTTKLAVCPSIPGAITGRMSCTFITCSCYHRQSWLASPQRRDLFLTVFRGGSKSLWLRSGGLCRHARSHSFADQRAGERAIRRGWMQAIKQGFSRRDLKAARKRRVAAQPELFREPSPGFHRNKFHIDKHLRDE